jgi:putative two-component system hydrogenase maturation factor HypX/HoxX
VGTRVALLYTRFGSMAQAFWTTLRDDGHEVIRPEDLGFTPPLSADAMLAFAELAAPDVLFCPFLKEIVPAPVCQRWTTWIPHPGIRGDRGSSSLAWAILNREPTWGLTMVKAEPATEAEELDGGNVGAWREFPLLPDATMAEAYAQYVIPAAIACAREILGQMATDPAYRGVPLADCRPARLGQYRRPLRQEHLAFTWEAPAEEILRRVRAAPFGVRVELAGQQVNVYDAHGPEKTTWFQPPSDTIVAHRDGAVLVATGDGKAVWIGHAKRKPDDGGRGLKLPAVDAVRAQLNGHPESLLDPARPPGDYGTYQVIRYRRVGSIGWIDARPYNGAASTTFCRRLLAALQYAAAQDTTTVVMAGGPVAFSNGIHLSVIEAAADPCAEAWANIQAIDQVADYVFQLSRDPSRPQTTIAVLGASAGAGGAVLSACFTHVIARPGINLNYHYGLVGLPGSELRSLVLPLRAGPLAAEQLLADCLPISPARAQHLGLVDAIGPDDPAEFDGWAQEYAAAIAGERQAPRSRIDTRPYLEQELREMHGAIFADQHGFAAKRRGFLGVAASPPTSPDPALILG